MWRESVSIKIISELIGMIQEESNIQYGQNIKDKADREKKCRGVNLILLDVMMQYKNNSV